MNGIGELTLAGATDNSTGTIEANSGRVVFAKTGDYAAHSIGAAGVGLTVNAGAIVQLAGNLGALTNGTGSNVPLRISRLRPRRPTTWIKSSI
jgi:hypothetical protein